MPFFSLTKLYKNPENLYDEHKYDIRGFSRKKLNLYRFNYSRAFAGLPPLKMRIQTIVLSIFSVIIGVFVSFAAIWATGLLSFQNISINTVLPGAIVLFIVIVILLVTTQLGFDASVKLAIIFLTVIGILSVFIQSSSINGILFYTALATIQEILSIWLISLTVASARTHNISIFANLSIAALLGTGIVLMLAVQPNTRVQFDLADVIVIICIFFSGGIIGWNAFNPTSKFSGTAKLAINLTSIGGTSFRLSNLSEADFSDAILKHTDFRDTDITRTCWRNAKGLEFARIDNTYLANPKIRQLVISCNGEKQIFDGLGLTGVNLQDSKLQSASFIGANLNNTCLRYADLSSANLRQAQLDGADLTGAILTGACIEDWGITNTTKLDNVVCDYIYMRVPTSEKPNPLRKPDDEEKNFDKGEFADFIKPYFDTLDLYHRQNIDPRAISIAIKNLSDNHPEDKLQFVAIEWRGNGLNIKYTSIPSADKSELSREYFENYAQIRKELLSTIQFKLASQDAEISRMESMIDKFIQTGTHQSTVHAGNIQVIQGGMTMTENKGININANGGSIGDISGLIGGDVSGVVNLGAISGNVTNSINQLPDSPKSDHPSLKELLTQLQQAIQNDTSLSDPDKADLLEQIQSLVEAKHAEEPVKKEGLVRKAMKIFNATLQSLPNTAKIVEACSKLLPSILKILGIPI